MMLALKPFVAPARYNFVDPDTGFKYQEKTREALVQRIVLYRSQNSLEPLEHLNLVLEHYWCTLDENAGSCIRNKDIKRGFFETLKGGITVLKNLYFGDDNMVDQAQADARSEVCAGSKDKKPCPFNTFQDRDAFVKWSDDIAVASVGSRRSSKHDELGNCNVCSCPLRAKVWHKGTAKLNDIMRAQMNAVGCWQTKEEAAAKDTQD